MLRTSLIGMLVGATFFSSGCGGESDLPEMTIVIRMIDQQDRWFRHKIKEFAASEGVRLNVVTFNSVADVQRMLALDAGSQSGRIGLVKTHKAMMRPLVDENLMLPLDEIVGPEQLQRDLEDYLTVAVEPAYFNRRCYYLPRKLETYTLLFIGPRVQDAVRHWEPDREMIDRLFRETVEGGKGLPPDYHLESDPARWDWHDLAVVAYYWRRRPYGGRTDARMAHRGRRYAGTMTELATKIFQAGGTGRDLLEVSTPAVYTAFEWEAFFRKNGLYNASMWEQRWAGGGIWKAMSNGLVFLAFMHQLDAFFIHGLTELEGYLARPEEMETAIMPRAASLSGDDSDAFGHYSQKSGWWWGIPRASPDPVFSYRLARHITSDEFHREEVLKFGMVPVTRRVNAELEQLLSGPEKEWMRGVFRTARRQFGLESDLESGPAAGVREIPAHPAWPSIQEIWLEAWYDIVVDGNYSREGPEGKVDRAWIADRLESYSRRIEALIQRTE